MNNQRRRSTNYIRPFWCVMIVCALAGPSFAQDKPSRDYPPTYSNRKAPWYDITTWFSSSSSEPKAEPKHTPEPANTPAPTSTPPMNPVVAQPIHQHGNEPAWKWYGYGAPAPGANPYAPAGTYQTVPPSWHQVVGSTPGAIPLAQLHMVGQPLLEQPRQPNNAVTTLPQPAAIPPLTVPATASERKPILPEGSAPYPLVKVPNEILDTTPPKLGSPELIAPIPASTKTDDVDWKPAKLVAPISETPSVGPRATLKAPVPNDGEPTKKMEVPGTDPALSKPSEERKFVPAPPPGVALPSVNNGTPDIPLNPAVGIRIPD